MPENHPRWHRKSEPELRRILRLVWEGRAIGTWQLRDRAELQRVFPGFAKFEYGYQIAAAASDTWFSTPEAAASFSALPWPAAAWGRLPDPGPADPASASPGPPPIPDWEILSWEEWETTLGLLGYPDAGKGRPARMPE
jgi:hypothetical protein